jgi:hypothetical protein
MIKNSKNMTTTKFLLTGIAFLLLLFGISCSEEKRYDINSDDKIPPAAPIISGYDSLPGAVRISYTPPADDDVISVEAQYTRASDGKTFRFSTSYFSTSILVSGLADTIFYDLELYAVDRAGNHSPKITYRVKPLESAILKVKKTMIVKGGFDAVFAKWNNELREAVNVYLDYTFKLNGTTQTLTRVFTSSDLDNWYYITDLVVPTNEPVKVKYRVSDEYGNVTDNVEVPDIFVLKDVEVPKLDADRNPLWVLPESRSVPLSEFGSNVRQVYGDDADGKLAKVMDGYIDENGSRNYMYTTDGQPWSLIIDLQKYYELSRIVTHQKHVAPDTDFTEVGRGAYYRMGNIGQYRMYRWDTLDKRWDLISFHKNPLPYGTISELEYNRLGKAGDMAYMYPDDPQYTKPTRWFRYEAVSGFDNNYAASGGGALSEITLYCKEVK